MWFVYCNRWVFADLNQKWVRYSDDLVDQFVLTLYYLVLDAASNALQFWGNQANVELKYTQYLNKEAEARFQAKERYVTRMRIF